MPKAKFLFWIDLETSGTDEHADPILEAAWIITTRMHPFDELSHGSLVVEPDKNQWPMWRSRMDPFVLKMHSSNGLLDDIDQSTWHSSRGVTITDLQEAIVSHLSLHGNKGEYLIAGSGVSHFDRQMIKAQMPLVNEWLQYPSFDVGVLRRCLESLYYGNQFVGEAYGANIIATSGTAHRAQDDIRDHLNEWRIYSAFFQNALNGIYEGIEV